jgi:hypothetical protein
MFTTAKSTSPETQSNTRGAEISQVAPTSALGPGGELRQNRFRGHREAKQVFCAQKAYQCTQGWQVSDPDCDFDMEATAKSISRNDKKHH